MSTIGEIGKVNQDELQKSTKELGSQPEKETSVDGLVFDVNAAWIENKSVTRPVDEKEVLEVRMQESVEGLKNTSVMLDTGLSKGQELNYWQHQT